MSRMLADVCAVLSFEPGNLLHGISFIFPVFLVESRKLLFIFSIIFLPKPSQHLGNVRVPEKPVPLLVPFLRWPYPSMVGLGSGFPYFTSFSRASSFTVVQRVEGGVKVCSPLFPSPGQTSLR